MNSAGDFDCPLADRADDSADAGEPNFQFGERNDGGDAGLCAGDDGGELDFQFGGRNAGGVGDAGLCAGDDDDE